MDVDCFSLGPLLVNTYVLRAGDQLALVDPGFADDELEARVDSLGGRVAYILLTHGHGDHIAAVEKYRARWGALLLAGDAELPMLADARKNLTAMFGSNPVEIRDVDRALKDGDQVTLGNFELAVITTPGHTTGSICFHCASEKILFTGDLLFAGSVGRSDFPGGDPHILADSLKRLTHLPDETRVLPGHGPATTIGREKRVNPFWPRR